MATRSLRLCVPTVEGVMIRGKTMGGGVLQRGRLSRGKGRCKGWRWKGGGGWAQDGQVGDLLIQPQ